MKHTQGLWLGPQKGHNLRGGFARATATGRVRGEGDWEGKVWAGRACSPPHPHLHIQVSSGIQQHLHHRLVPTDAGVHQGGHALRWLKPETETFTRWLWSVDKHMERLIGLRLWHDK